MKYLIGYFQSPFRGNSLNTGDPRFGMMGGGKSIRLNHFKLRAIPEKDEENTFEMECTQDQDGLEFFEKQDFMDKEFSIGSS